MRYNYIDFEMKINEVLGHPVRGALLACLTERQLTRQQLHERLPEIPAPTIYRNLRLLVQAGLIYEVDRIKKQGPGEVIYAAVDSGPWVSAEEVAHWSPEERAQALQVWAYSLVASFRSYQALGGSHPAIAGAHLLFLTVEERIELEREIRAVIAKYVGLEKTADRLRWQVGDAYIPESG